MTEEIVRVFISYSWDSEEHKKKVLALSNSLRRYGIDCQIDRYYQAPPGGWHRWMMDQIEGSHFVLVICTANYNQRYRNKEERGQGRGATWEGGLIIEELYDEQGINEKYIPIVLSREDEQGIPRSLKSYTVYRLFNETYDPAISGGFQDLYRHLTGQPASPAPPVGSRTYLPPENYDVESAEPPQESPQHLTNQPTLQAPPVGELLTFPPNGATSPVPDNPSFKPTYPVSENELGNGQKTEEVRDETRREHPQPDLPPQNTIEPESRLLQKARQLISSRGVRSQHIFLSTVLLVIALGGVLTWQNSARQTPNSSTIQSLRGLEQRISAGERILTKEESEARDPVAFEAEKRRGVQAIADGDYWQAEMALERAIQLYRNAPETLIYLNNARIGSNKAYTIAVVAPTDSTSDAALSALRGVAQAQNEVNKQGGIDGVPLRIAIVNDNDDPDIASELASDLANNPEILGVVGHFSSGVTLDTRRIYAAQQLPSISATSTSISLSTRPAGNTSVYGFRVVPNDGIAARALADYMTGTLQKSKVAIFYEQGSTYSESLKTEFSDSVFQGGGEVVDEFDISRGSFNAQNAVDRARENGADVLMLAPSPSSIDKALQIIQANEGSLALLGGDALYTSPRVLQEGGEKALNMVLAVFWDIDANRNSEFSERSTQLWGGDVNWITAMTYDATQAFIKAMAQSSDVTRENIQKALSNDDFSIEGASGTVRFSPNGDRRGKAQLVEVQTNPGTEFGYDFVPIP